MKTNNSAKPLVDSREEPRVKSNLKRQRLSARDKPLRNSKHDWI